MKYLLVTALIVGIFWLWRRNRQVEKDTGAPPRPSPSKGVSEMVACRVCQVHLPRSEALIGRDSGLYCSEAHRRQAEG